MYGFLFFPFYALLLLRSYLRHHSCFLMAFFLLFGGTYC
nr:MAG TPA: hypothetical protein [Ackermannviridae sp.]